MPPAGGYGFSWRDGRHHGSRLGEIYTQTTRPGSTAIAPANGAIPMRTSREEPL
jgi:hypothetical protein